MANFSVWDYVVFILMLIISAGIGVYYRFTGGKQKTTNVSSSVPRWFNFSFGELVKSTEKCEEVES